MLKSQRNFGKKTNEYVNALKFFLHYGIYWLFDLNGLKNSKKIKIKLKYDFILEICYTGFQIIYKYDDFNSEIFFCLSYYAFFFASQQYL